MTVAELIDELLKMPQQRPVRICVESETADGRPVYVECTDVVVLNESNFVAVEGR